MAFTIRKVDYFYATAEDETGAGYRILSQLAELGINLLAFVAVPIGPARTQLTLFPEDTSTLQSAAAKAQLPLDGPHRALLVQGDDELGALAGLHERLAQAGVQVYASSGVTDGRGSYGYVRYVRPEEFARAAAAMDL
jgi:predicted amino acid-binding ACT domain protein